jgi:hypothetical protein
VVVPMRDLLNTYGKDSCLSLYIFMHSIYIFGVGD